jgi:hypothetical protein
VRSLALALLLVLGACAGTAETRATNALAVACDSYATVLEQLVPFKADLTLTQIGRVDAANTIAAVPCSSGSTIDPAEGVGAVKAAINLINAVFGEAS